MMGKAHTSEPWARFAPAAARLAWRILGGVALCAGAAAHAPALLTVGNPWVRATVEGQTGSGAYMELTSREDARLTGASASVAERVEVHEMRMDHDMMRMRRLDSLALPKNTTVALDHQYHIMLIGLRRQLQVGQTVQLTLHLIDATGARRDQDVLAPVRALNTAMDHPRPHE